MTIFQAAGFWLILPFVGIANGILREKLINPYTGPYLGHVISCLTISVPLFAAGYLFARLFKISLAGAAGAGFTWMALTIAFEFLFGRFVMKHTWAFLFHDYNILEGRLWVLVLFFALVAPIVGYHIHHHPLRV